MIAQQAFVKGTHNVEVLQLMVGMFHLQYIQHMSVLFVTSGQH
jgi:hypothetical protein